MPAEIRPTHVGIEFRLTIAQAEMLKRMTLKMQTMARKGLASVASSPEEQEQLDQAISVLISRIDDQVDFGT